VAELKSKWGWTNILGPRNMPFKITINHISTHFGGCGMDEASLSIFVTLIFAFTMGFRGF
jgi:hypothetical protein